MTPAASATPTLLPHAVSLLLLAVIGVLAAQITWQAVEPDLRPPVTAEIRAQAAAPAAGPSDSPLVPVAGMPLFGVLAARTETAPAVAPETRLRLRLVGLVAGESPEEGRAIIAEGGGPERLYGVGDALGGGQARLHQIHADRVILDHDGSYETLRLPRPDETGSPAAGAAPPAPRAAAAPDQPRVQRSEWLADPERLTQSVQARPVIRDGSLHGLEVRPARNARQFQQAGLRPGDVITSVNGMPLSAIEDTDRLFQDLASQSQVDIVVERDGLPLPLTIQLID
jgi:general secretion pathway protein C